MLDPGSLIFFDITQTLYRVFELHLNMRYIFFSCLFVCVQSVAQVNSAEVLDQLATKLIQQYKSDAKELIVLHADKSVYRAGSSIWFRTYSVSSNGFPVENRNKMIMVELVNDQDSVVERTILNEDSLQFHGSVQIPDYISEGWYHLRAWTKTILQQHPADIFIAPVYVVQGKAAVNDGNTTNLTEPVIRFYPEGNNLVNGVNCVVAYTATDKLGNPLDIVAVVKDNNDKEVISFSGKGIGQFTFEPYSKDRTYKVFVKNGNTADLVYSLPAISAEAYQLSLQQQTADQLVFRVALGDLAYNQKASSYLVGVSAGKICFASAGTGMYMVNVPTDSVAHGLADFYLFNERKEIVSRRTVFIDKLSSVINITTDRPDYLPRQRVNVSVSITDKNNQPVKSALSVSVTDSRLVSEPASMHAADVFLLQRNSTGLQVPDLIKDNTTRDTWLLTINSSGHFLPADPVIKTDKNYYWDGLEFKARITNKQQAPVMNELVTLLSDQNEGTLHATTDDKGVFSFRDLMFYGRQRFYVMVPGIYNKQQDFDVMQEPTPYPVIHSSSFVNSTYQKSILNKLSEFKAKQGDSIIISEARVGLQQIVLENSDEKRKTAVPKKGLSGQRITAEKLDKLSLSNTADAVKMLPGVIMMGGKLTIRGGLQTVTGAGDIEPLLIVDGVPTNAGSVVDYLNSIPPSNIEYIEVLTGPEAAIYGTRGGNGAIVVKTANQTRDKQSIPGKEKQTIIASGFYKPQPFYEPPYDNYTIREAAFTDNRATLYWNGQIITDAAGKAGFSFYTSDLKNDYTITVQGITDKGELVYKTYTVKKR